MKVQALFGFLCALALCLFSGLAQVAAQEEFIAGSWAGVYQLADRVELFFIIPAQRTEKDQATNSAGNIALFGYPRGYLLVL